MKYFFAILFVSLPLFASDITITQRTAIYGGLALAVGEGSESMNPGMNAGLESFAKIGRYYGVGCNLEYTWLTVNFPAAAPDDWRGSLHYWNISLTQKLFYDVNDIFGVFGEAAPGFYLGLATIRSNSDKDHEWEPDFGLSFGSGFTANYFLFKFNFKVVFTEYESTKWVLLSVGYGG